MHTATRLALPVLKRVRALNSQAHLCCYGLYAPLNEAHLRNAGVQSIIGGEFEAALSRWLMGCSLSRKRLWSGCNSCCQTGPACPSLSRYPKLVTGSGKKRVGYTEASRGCKHLCRHCPVVPVYNGAFRVVPMDIVLADIRQQVAAGAEHITFGDPDFLNGPTHARADHRTASRGISGGHL